MQPAALRGLAYDLHLHTCLSPCGDPEMTPPNLVQMALLGGLEVIAVTDHNSTRNVGAVLAAARGTPLRVIPGVEVTTAEDIHAVCLFPTVEAAQAAGAELETLLPPIPNRSDIFGHQWVMDAGERVAGEVERLLLSATTLSIDRLPDWAAGYGGLCWPAHIDRGSYSILSVLGMLPPEPVFPWLEVARPQVFFAQDRWQPLRGSHQILTSSDAHRLADMVRPLHRLAPDDPLHHWLLQVPQEG